MTPTPTPSSFGLFVDRARNSKKRKSRYVHVRRSRKPIFCKEAPTTTTITTTAFNQYVIAINLIQSALAWDFSSMYSKCVFGFGFGFLYCADVCNIILANVSFLHFCFISLKSECYASKQLRHKHLHLFKPIHEEDIVCAALLLYQCTGMHNKQIQSSK